MILEPLRADHFATLRVQSAQRFGARALDTDPAYQAEMVKCEGSWAAVADGVTMGVGGMIDLGGGRAYAWTLIAAGIGRHFVALHRAVWRALLGAPYHRIEMHVDPAHDAAVRWAIMLGFDFECVARRFFPDRSDAYLFARVR